MQSYFPTGQFFFRLFEIDKLVSTQRFSPKREKISLKFRIVNLCNGGTKDFVELWEIIHLKIWTHFSIRQTKLFWINLEHYSQTCSNDHLCRATTCLRWPMLSPPKQIPIQSLLCKTTTCLTRPATTFSLPNKKSLSKTTTESFIQQRNAKQT